MAAEADQAWKQPACALCPGGPGYRGQYDSADGLALRDLGQEVIDLRHRSALDRNRPKILPRHEAEQFAQLLESRAILE
jgi:hypothetical protein